jgi:hypothetical protein
VAARHDGGVGQRPLPAVLLPGTEVDGVADTMIEAFFLTKMDAQVIMLLEFRGSLLQSERSHHNAYSGTGMMKSTNHHRREDCSLSIIHYPLFS